MFYYDNTGATPAGNQIYRRDNTLNNPLQIRMTVEGNEMSYDPNMASPPASAPINNITPLPSDSVEALVLAAAGARPADRDEIDRRIINQVSGRTSAGYIKSQTQVGGYPPLAVNTRTLTVPANPHTTATSGYTNLEVWLQSYAAAVEGGSGSTSGGTAPAAPTGVMVVSGN